MAGKTLSFFNLTGGLNTVQTMATINSTTNRTESPDMVNIEYFKLSGLRTMNGNVGLNSNNSIGSEIDFGYEYVQGNNRYMIVADRQHLYEYQPTTDTFTTVFTFDYAAEVNSYITICGYANGIVAACPNSLGNGYLVYYRKGRTKEVGTVTTHSGATLDYTGSYISALGTGDVVIIDTVKYEIESVDVDNSQITLTDTPSATITSKSITLTDITKIPCIYTSVVQNGNQTDTTTTTFYPKIIQSHQGRLWVGARIGDDEVASYAIYSDLGNIHNMFEGGDASAYDAGYFAEFWEDTSDITAIGTWDKYVVVHKREHTYLINTSASDATTWNVESYSEYTCENQRGFVKANNGYYVYTTSGGGIYPMIQRTIYSAISQGAEASVKIRDTFNNINLYALDKIFAVYHPLKKYIMFYMPMVGENGSNNCYILDLQTKSWLHRQVPQNVTTAFEFDNKVYIGTKDGKVYEEFRGLDFAGETIKFSWKSPWFIWGNGTNWTTTREIRVKMSQEGTNNFFIRNRRDGAEDYKERTITNTSTKTNNLMWDEGILDGDINPDYINSFPVYSYVDNDGKTWYSFDNKITPESFIFETSPTKVGISGSEVAATIPYKELSDSSAWDDVVWGDDAIFAFTWKGTKAQYKCYQSSVDSNIKIWVDSSNTSKGVINISYQESNPWYGMNFPPLPGEHAQDTLLGYITKADYEAKWNTPNSYILLYNQPNVPYLYNGAQLYVYVGANPNATATVNNLDGRRVVYLYGGYYPLFWGNPVITSAPTGGWAWNGSYTRSGINIDGQFTYSDTQVVYDNITYNRYPGGDEGVIEATDEHGNPIEDTVFSNKETLSVNDIVYTTDSLTTQAGTVISVSGTNYTLDNNKVYTPDYSQGSPGTDPEYYLYKAPFTWNTSGTDTGVTVDVFYQVPNEGLTDTKKLLTDSKWDGNEEFEVNGVTYPASYTRNAQGAIINNPPDSTPPDSQSTWVNTGQVTKRFPIDRQYFQTLQLEFCGEVENQGIELYGFEVDGIQLTEVPW